MPETPPLGPPTAGGSSGLPLGAAAPAPWLPTPPMAFRQPSRWPVFAALALAIIAVVLGIAGLFRPSPHHVGASPTTPAPAFTDQQVADAKSHVCTAYRRVSHAVAINTTGEPPPASDRIATIAIATNARLALHDGADYLADTLTAEPATPANLAEAVRSLSHAYRELTLIDFAEEPQVNQEPVRQTIDRDMTILDRLCNV
ncbi:hypothetical protein MSIMFB_01951 [Mycobacterium simulans]|uniref:Alanine and proline rich membrane protein n=1 Tax=Mycobacterium simulans TaxID=627089 RepID=A0A7Z7IJK5_9MYCO|nr:hypothetical protein MSIMFB_01951 [Mycobacterium simulans]